MNAIKSSRRGKCLGADAALAATLCALCFVSGCQPKKEPALSGALRGLPRTPIELNAWYAEPSRNAAEAYRQGFDAIRLDRSACANLPILGKGQLPRLGEPMPDYIKGALRTVVRANQDALAWFAQGAGYERCRYPVDLTRGFEAIFPDTPRLKQAVLLAAVSAIVHAEAGDGKQASDELLSGLALARSAEAEPVLLSQVFRMAEISIMITALERTLNRAEIPKESLSALAGALGKMETYEAQGEGIKRGMAGDRVCALSALANPQQLMTWLAMPDLDADVRSGGTARVQRGGKFNAEERCLEASYDEIFAVRQSPFPGRLKVDDLIRRRLADPVTRKLVLMGLFLPGLAGRTTQEAECLARLRLATAAVALQQFRADHSGASPDALSQMTPQYLPSVPEDPFDGQPLRLVRKDQNYILYSIGPDLTDGSGAQMAGKEGDIVLAMAPVRRSGK